MNERGSARRQPNRFPTWAKAVVGAMFAVLLAGLLVPHLFPADRYRSALTVLFERETGRQVSFGKMQVAILPRPGIVLEQFQIANPDGFAQGDFVVAPEARCEVALLPLLLRHQLRLTAVELLGPKVSLLKNASGQDNYTLLPNLRFGNGREPPSQNQKAQNPGQGRDTAGTMPSVRLDELELVHGDIAWGSVDGQGHADTLVQVDGVNVVLRHLVFEPPNLRKWEAEGNIRGARVRLPGWKIPITMTSGGVSLHDGKLKARFAADCGTVALVTGKLDVANVEHPVAKFQLRTSKLDLNALIADHTSVGFARTQNSEAPPSASSGGAVPSAKEKLLAQGHLSAKAVLAAGYVTGPASADLRLYADRLEIWPLTLRFERGSVQVSARTDRDQTPERFSANVQARNIDVEQVLRQWPSLRGRLAGTGELDLQIFGSLDAGWVRSLWGKGQFLIRNGRIAGVNLAAALQPGADFAGGDTIFTAASGDLSLHDGRVDSRDIHLYAYSPHRVADLRGSFDFDGALRYEGQISSQGAVVPARLADLRGDSLSDAAETDPPGKSVTAAFALGGTLRHPVLRPGHGLMKFSSAAENDQKGRLNGSPYPNLFGKQ